MQRHDEFHEAKAAWNRLSYREKRDLVSDLPTHVATDKKKLYLAAWLLEQCEHGRITPMGFQRRWQDVIRGAI